MDGRGIGYRKKARLNWMRGTQVRKVKGHIRCEVVMTKGRYKLIQYVGVGKRYSFIGDKDAEGDFKGSRFEWGEVFSRQVI